MTGETSSLRQNEQFSLVL